MITIKNSKIFFLVRKSGADDELIKKSSRLLKHERLNKEQKEAYSLHSRKLI